MSVAEGSQSAMESHLCNGKFILQIIKKIAGIKLTFQIFGCRTATKVEVSLLSALSAMPADCLNKVFGITKY